MLLRNRVPSARPAARPAKKCGRTPLRVVAFKGHDATRAEMLTDIGNQYAKAWIKGVHDGPDVTAHDLGGLVDNNVQVYSAHSPFSARQSKGLHSLLTKVDTDRRRGMQPDRVLHVAANEVEDTVYMLVENRPRKSGGCPAVEDLADADKLPKWSGRSMDEWDFEAHSCPLVTHSVVKLDVLLDDSACRITAIRECCQPAYDTGPAFPIDRVVPYTALKPQDTDRNHSIGEAWCKSLSTGGELSLLDRTTNPDLFLFFDAYGHIDKYARQSPTNIGHSLQWLKSRNLSVQKDFTINARLVDNVASPTHTIGFMHWRAEFTPRHPEGGLKAFVVNCVQAETYQSTGKEVKLTSVWAFRDLMRTEEEEAK